MAKMERTLTLKTDEGDTFAVLKNITEEETLLSVRQKLEETPCQEFSFLLFGISLKPKQESKTLVRDCSQRNNKDGGIELTVKTTCTVKPQKVFSVTSSPSSEDGASTASVKTSPSPTSPSKDAPEPDEVQDLKINRFSSAEIEAAQDLFAKERMRYHNGLLEKIKGNEELSNWGPQELLGVIESSWVMKKTGLLKYKVKEILAQDISSTTDCKGRDKVLMRNLDSVEKATFDVNAEYAKFSDKIRENEANRPVLEANFDKVFSALKKSQANLQKSIEEFLKKQDNASVSEQCESPTPAVRLSEDEVSVLAEDVKEEYESD